MEVQILLPGYSVFSFGKRSIVVVKPCWAMQKFALAQRIAFQVKVRLLMAVPCGRFLTISPLLLVARSLPRGGFAGACADTLHGRCFSSVS